MIALIGTGYWGSKILTTLQEMDIVVDQFDIKDNIQQIKSQNVIVATPADTHAEITEMLLQQNKNVLVEKPAFMNMEECTRIEKSLKSKYMSGHILLYSEHFDLINQRIKDENIRHIECRRLNWGRAQKNISPILHLASHDIAVLDTFIRHIPNTVNCRATYIKNETQPDYVVADLDYGQTTAQIQMGWHYNEKIRNIKVFTENKIYDWKDEINQTVIFENQKEEFFKEIDSSLKKQLEAFLNYCEKDVEPISNFAHTKRVTYVIECMEKSFKNKEVIRCSKIF